MRIEQAIEVTLELVTAFERLLPQLSPRAPLLTARDLEEIVHAAGTALFVARDPGEPGRIVGSATLVFFRIPTGRRARLESVVVDAAARGRGVGEALCQAAVAHATAAAVTTLDLTSAPERGAANRLYARLGFQRRETNVYRLVLAVSPERSGPPDVQDRESSASKSSRRS